MEDTGCYKLAMWVPYELRLIPGSEHPKTRPITHTSIQKNRAHFPFHRLGTSPLQKTKFHTRKALPIHQDDINKLEVISEMQDSLGKG